MTGHTRAMLNHLKKNGPQTARQVAQGIYHSRRFTFNGRDIAADLKFQAKHGNVEVDRSKRPFVYSLSEQGRRRLRLRRSPRWA